ncbi:MAG: SAM-dependent chlorinase/fluorinase [Chloroflexi bacterium]|nr:SAM-dependent chlorinase/fluorinase [Chloroflexota bacterium]
MHNPIVLLTDFGTRDAFVGIMKGVIARINPAARMIDLNHNIPPGDIGRAALTLWQAADFFPKGSIFLSVIDPGVGTPRRAIIADNGTYRFVGPDNGSFSYVMSEDSPAWELANPQYMLTSPGMTFHGRDVFSPAAAHASLGVSPSSFGPAVPNPVRLPPPRLEITLEGSIHGEILHADHFGNLLTSLGQFTHTPEGQLHLTPWASTTPKQNINPAQYRVHLPDGRPLPWAKTFGEIPAGTCAALIGSTGLIEIAANRHSAAELLKLRDGDIVTIRSI